MTLIQTVGGGLVTLGGVAVGFLFARRSDQQKRWQEEITFWIGELSAIDRTLFAALGPNPQKWPKQTELDEETQLALFTMLLNLVYLLNSRPAPRDSVTDVVVNSIATGIFAPETCCAAMVLNASAVSGARCLATNALHSPSLMLAICCSWSADKSGSPIAALPFRVVITHDAFVEDPSAVDPHAVQLDGDVPDVTACAAENLRGLPCTDGRIL